MQTNKIKITNFEEGRKQALEETEKFSDYLGFDHKTALRVRLLAEETLGMVSTIAEKFSAEFWIEGKQDAVCKIHLRIRTEMDMEKKKELIAASKNKKNAAVKGLTGRLMEKIEEYLYLTKEAGVYDPNMFMTGMVDMPLAYNLPVQVDDVVWTLEDYRNEIDGVRETEAKAGEAWDELEKSILAKLADDVKVAVRGDEAEVIVEKKFVS